MEPGSSQLYPVTGQEAVGPNGNMGNCLNIRKRVFTAGVVERRHRLPREAVELEMFKTCLDMALGS